MREKKRTSAQENKSTLHTLFLTYAKYKGTSFVHRLQRPWDVWCELILVVFSWCHRYRHIVHTCCVRHSMAPGTPAPGTVLNSSARLSLVARKGVMSTMSERQNHHYTAWRGEHATLSRSRFYAKETYCWRERAMPISLLDNCANDKFSSNYFIITEVGHAVHI